MDSTPLVSVLMTTYNSEAFVGEAIESILAQTWKNWELLVADDGSSDGTKKILGEYEQKDKRIKLFGFKDNKGQARRLNWLLEKTKGKYVSRMDSDDVSLPKRIERQVAFLELHEEIKLLGTQFWMWYPKKNLKVKKPLPRNSDEIRFYGLYRCPFAHPTVMWRKGVVEKVGGYEDLLVAQDYALWSNIVYVQETANLAEYLLLNRQHRSSKSVKNFPLQVKATRQIGLKNITFLTENWSKNDRLGLYGFFKNHSLSVDDGIRSWRLFLKFCRLYLTHYSGAGSRLTCWLAIFKTAWKSLKIKLVILPWPEKWRLLVLILKPETYAGD